MKKRILIMATVIIGLGFTACSVDTNGLEDAADNMKKEMNNVADVPEKEVQETVSGETYQCPDDCENGPSYDVPGPCTKCGKDLVIL